MEAHSKIDTVGGSASNLELGGLKRLAVCIENGFLGLFGGKPFGVRPGVPLAPEAQQAHLHKTQSGVAVIALAERFDQAQHRL